MEKRKGKVADKDPYDGHEDYEDEEQFNAIT